MAQNLMVQVHLHDGRYHGSGPWPPSPARLFQALVAASATGRHLPNKAVAALEWLENCPPPLIAAPKARKGQRVKNYVPNNDLDSVGGDPGRVAEIRTPKIILPHFFDPDVPIVYAWQVRCEDLLQAEHICAMAKELYQFGRGVDMAWSLGELLDQDQLSQRLEEYPGRLHRPGCAGPGLALACPARGSLRSLTLRFEAQGRRLTWTGQGDERQFVLDQAPQPRFSTVMYDCGSQDYVFELRNYAWPLRKVAELVRRLQESACERLKNALPRSQPTLERVFCGHNSQGEVDKAERIRVIALPSIGHPHVDMSVRRIVVSVPGVCPLDAQDAAWAFAGLDLTEQASKVASLGVSQDDRMLEHYGFGKEFRAWRSVTPVVVPETAARRRIDPKRSRSMQEAKGGRERATEERAAVQAIKQALRHAQIDTKVERIHVQREPFQPQGEKAERFAPNSRFPKERLWHAEIWFTELVAGPLIVGDGRFQGLGLMAPVKGRSGVLGFRILEGMSQSAQAKDVSQALRRAVMARVQQQIGPRPLSKFFTGHEPEGGPSRDGHTHLAYIVDMKGSRLLLLAPHLINPSLNEHQGDLRTLERAMSSFSYLNAGSAGSLKVEPLEVSSTDPLLRSSRIWESVTDYDVARHPKRGACPEEALVLDVQAELLRRKYPVPFRVEVVAVRLGRRGGLSGKLRLHFRVAVSGPLVLGRTCHAGGGLFMAMP